MVWGNHPGPDQVAYYITKSVSSLNGDEVDILLAGFVFWGFFYQSRYLFKPLKLEP